MQSYFLHMLIIAYFCNLIFAYASFKFNRSQAAVVFLGFVFIYARRTSGTSQKLWTYSSMHQEDVQCKSYIQYSYAAPVYLFIYLYAHCVYSSFTLGFKRFVFMNKVGELYSLRQQYI